VRIRGGEGCQDVMFFEDSGPLFPFNWTSNPRLISGLRPLAYLETLSQMSEFERETVAYLETLSQMSIGDLLDAECSTNTLERYLRNSF
jgi:hypothetical protein